MLRAPKLISLVAFTWLLSWSFLTFGQQRDAAHRLNHDSAAAHSHSDSQPEHSHDTHHSDSHPLPYDSFIGVQPAAPTLTANQDASPRVIIALDLVVPSPASGHWLCAFHPQAPPVIAGLWTSATSSNRAPPLA